MYLYDLPVSLQVQHSIMYDTPSVVNLGRATVSSLEGLGVTSCPGLGKCLRPSSEASISLPLQGRQLVLLHIKSLA